MWDSTCAPHKTLGDTWDTLKFFVGWASFNTKEQFYRRKKQERQSPSCLLYLDNSAVRSDDAKAAILTIAAAILVAGLINPNGILSIVAHTVMDIWHSSQIANDSETNAFRVFGYSTSCVFRMHCMKEYTIRIGNSQVHTRGRFLLRRPRLSP